MELKELRETAAAATREVLEAAKLRPGDLFVVGCSSSEVLGEKMGTHTSKEVAGALYEGIVSVLEPAGILLAAQCCEHLNRALIVEEEAVRAYGLEQVNAVPHTDHAGGAFATVAYETMAHPVVVEDLKAQASAGMDIGGILIGMHIRPVAVPMHLSTDRIGKAVLLCARRRPKYVGGARAVYDEDLM